MVARGSRQGSRSSPPADPDMTRRPRRPWPAFLRRILPHPTLVLPLSSLLLTRRPAPHARRGTQQPGMGPRMCAVPPAGSLPTVWEFLSEEHHLAPPSLSPARSCVPSVSPSPEPTTDSPHPPAPLARAALCPPRQHSHELFSGPPRSNSPTRDNPQHLISAIAFLARTVSTYLHTFAVPACAQPLPRSPSPPQRSPHPRTAAPLPPAAALGARPAVARGSRAVANRRPSPARPGVHAPPRGPSSRPRVS